MMVWGIKDVGVDGEGVGERGECSAGGEEGGMLCWAGRRGNGGVGGVKGYWGSERDGCVYKESEREREEK